MFTFSSFYYLFVISFISLLIFFLYLFLLPFLLFSLFVIQTLLESFPSSFSYYLFMKQKRFAPDEVLLSRAPHPTFAEMRWLHSTDIR